MIVPPGSLVYGAPATVVSKLSLDEQGRLRGWAEKYVEVAKAHAARSRA
jgi:carbonic anhydrase/acetyltransferase-like protein (isoleucine patch superfamily)